MLFTVHYCIKNMSLQQQTPELRENGCNGHSSSVPYVSRYESQLLHSHVVRPNVNPFVHRLQLCAWDKLRVRIHLTTILGFFLLLLLLLKTIVTVEA